jgi:hypothetical protein
MKSTKPLIFLFVLTVFSLSLAAAPLCRTWYVTVDGTGDVPTIQAAIESAAPGDEILVAPGRYTWTNQGGAEFGLLTFFRSNHGFTVRSVAGPEVTILDAERRDRVAFLQGYNHVTIDGFTITGGDAPASDDYIGGGIAVHISEGDVIRNCLFVDNIADIGAGFWATSRCNTRVENCTFTGNHARRFAAGVGVGYSQNLVTITGCTIIDNTAGEYGAGMTALRSTVLVENTVFAGNVAGVRGGGLYAFDTESATFVGTTFSENGAPAGGGVYVAGVSSLTLERSIVAFSASGGGIVIEPAAAVELGCTDVFGNQGGDGWPAWVVDLGGNFSADPLFCGSPGSGDYTLRADSPCLPGAHPGGFDCGVVGAKALGCSGVPVRPVTWGWMKSLYHR